LPENWPIYPGPHSSPPLYLVIRGWPHDGGLPTRFRTEPQGLPPQKWMGRKILPIYNNAGLDIDFEWQIGQIEWWLKKYGTI